MDIEEVWNQLIQKLKSYPNINASQIDAFFSRIKIQAVSSGFLMLTTDPDGSFIKEWVERNYINDIKKALFDLYGIEFHVQIEIDNTAQRAPQSIPTTPTYSNQINESQRISSAPLNINTSNKVLTQRNYGTQTTTQNPNINTELNNPSPETTSYRKEVQQEVPTQNNKSKASQDKKNVSLTPSLTFDNYVIGDSNKMAYSMALEVAEKPQSNMMNPLFIYGRSGVGKTHLLCAIRNYILEQYKELSVYYIDSMELVNKYSDAATENSTDKRSFKNFEKLFDDSDIILIDDIQGLQDKPGTLSVLFRMFNNLIAQGKQFVFSADRAPKNIDLDERYTSRFNSGATIDIQPPDNETKRNIIKKFISEYKKEENFSLELSEDVINYIVEHSSSNIRELKSAINNVIFTAKIDNKKEISKEEVRELLANHFINENESKLTIETIQRAVSDFYNIPYSDLVSKKRQSDIAHARHIAIYLCRELLICTLNTIGKEFNRDHSTVKHSCELIQNDLKVKRDVREEVEAIREKLRIQQY